MRIILGIKRYVIYSHIQALCLFISVMTVMTTDIQDLEIMVVVGIMIGTIHKSLL